MKYELRIIGLRLLGTVLGLVAGGLMVAIVFVTFPAFLDMRAGRVVFPEVRGPLFLGIGAGIGIVAVMLVLVWLKVVIQREREAAKWHTRQQVATRRVAKEPIATPPPRRRLTPPTGPSSSNSSWTGTAIVAAIVAACRTFTYTTLCLFHWAAPTKWVTCARSASPAIAGCIPECTNSV